MVAWVATLIFIASCSAEPTAKPATNGPLVGLGGDAATLCLPARGSRDFTEAFHALSVDPPADFVTVTGVDLINEVRIELGKVYLVPMSGRNVLNVLNYFPPTQRDLRYVNADWNDALTAVGSRLESGQLYLFVGHLQTSRLPASFDSIEMTYEYAGKPYSTRTQIRVEITGRKSCF